jgi:hypothetical protein
VSEILAVMVALVPMKAQPIPDFVNLRPSTVIVFGSVPFV